MERSSVTIFVAALPCYRHRADLAEAAQPVVVFRLPGQGKDFERASQIHVEAALLRLAIERSGAMNNRIGGVDQAIEIVSAQAETWKSNVAHEDSHLRLQVLVKERKVQMQL